MAGDDGRRLEQAYGDRAKAKRRLKAAGGQRRGIRQDQDRTDRADAATHSKQDPADDCSCGGGKRKRSRNAQAPAARAPSGGPSSGFFKSTDGGDHWTEITRNPGLPAGIVGKIGVTVSGADSNRVFAIVENENGGVFASDDAGAKWTKRS